MPSLAETKSGSDASERLSSQFSMPSSAAFHGPRTLPAVLRVLSVGAEPSRTASGMSWDFSSPVPTQVIPPGVLRLPSSPRRQRSCPAPHTACICCKQTATLPSHQFQRPLRFSLHWLNHTLHKSYSHIKTKGFHSFGVRGRHTWLISASASPDYTKWNSCWSRQQGLNYCLGHNLKALDKWKQPEESHSEKKETESRGLSFAATQSGD